MLDPVDIDSDGIPDAIDSDQDGDGTIDKNDDFPQDSASIRDTDGDGVVDRFDLDDVVMSGRTIRAAMNELFDYGRPRRVLLACLVELRGRELPVQPDALGANLALAPGKRIKLEGPDNLRLTLVDTGEVTA